MAIPSVLKRILLRKSEEIAIGKSNRSYADLAAMAKECPPPRGFEKSLRSALEKGPAVIAEVKKASPSAGIIREDFQPDDIARSYQSAGAACLSVLTDKDFFQGEAKFLQQARGACSIPVLRKDFIIDPWQILESRVMGADCILLIVSALEQTALQELLSLAKACDLDVLVEVHDEIEMERALSLDHELIGVNNRNLNTFKTSLATSERLQEMLSPDQLLVTESGIRTNADVMRMQAA
jgi:indole-3-glycerol phosphate synthase